jgi:aryl-alcohol dehydrogenase-like predicted oxidoreductase
VQRGSAQEAARFRSAIVLIAESHDATIAQIALAWQLHRSPLTLPIPGTTDIAHLKENSRRSTSSSVPTEQSY